MPTIPYKNAAGQRISGVTTIIGTNLGWNKEPLMYWANRIGRETGLGHREVSKLAADSGTVCHEMIDCEIKGRELDWEKIYRMLKKE